MQDRHIQKKIHTLRELTPLSVRRKVGPAIAYIYHLYSLYLKNSDAKPHVLSLEDTLDLIYEKNLSVVRFGDGEISLIDNHNLGFQTTNHELSEKLKTVLSSNQDGLLICVPGIWGKLSHFKKVPYWFTLHHLFKHGHVWESLLNTKQTYGDAYISRPYLTFKDNPTTDIIFKKFFKLWEHKNIVIIEGEKSRLGVGNDMFNNTQSVKRILCPAENAYSRYEAIKAEALKLPKDVLILLALGPAAKVLAYDLFLTGYRVLDIGHIDMEYEMFVRKETKLVKVPYKYFNEINERTPEACTDPEYLSQIITTIQSS